MSSQAGIFYFDGRPVSDEIARQISGALGATDTDARGEHRAAGLFMAYAASWFDDLGKTEKQPFVSSQENVVTFDGRLDNRTDLLLQLYRRLDGQITDPALALAAFEDGGEQSLFNLIGDWSLAIWEPAGRSLLLASDYAGMRALFYHANSERVVWSSYLKPLAAFVGTPELDEQFVAGFIVRMRPPGLTPYRDIFSVPTGRAVQFSSHGTTTTAFWTLPVHNEIRYADERDYDAHLRSLFRDSMLARLRTSYPAFMELSGGWDSSSNVCVANDLITGRHVEAPGYITLGYAIPGGRDAEYTAFVRRFCGIQGITIDMKQFLHFNRNHLDDAVPNAAGAMYDELARHAHSQSARTYFAGHSGDTVMGNHPEDCEQVAGQLRRGRLRAAWNEAIAWSTSTRMPLWSILLRGTLACLPPRWRSSKSYFFQDPGFTLKERRGDWLTPHFKKATGLHDPDAFVSREWHNAVPEKRKILRLISRQLESREFYGPPERLQHFYYVDPYLHRPLLEFALALPPDQLCRPQEPRRLMRRAFRQWVPPELADRISKGDVMAPISEALQAAAGAILADSQPLRVIERGYVDSAVVHEQLRLSKDGRPCQMNRLIQVVTLELWMRHNEGKTFR